MRSHASRRSLVLSFSALSDLSSLIKAAIVAKPVIGIASLNSPHSEWKARPYVINRLLPPPDIEARVETTIKRDQTSAYAQDRIFDSGPSAKSRGLPSYRFVSYIIALIGGRLIAIDKR